MSPPPSWAPQGSPPSADPAPPPATASPANALPAPTTSAPTTNPVLSAWPRSAQLAAAFLLGSATALLALYCISMGRGGTRPSERVRLAYRIDLNRADRAELLQLPGVGEALADRVLAHRDQRGGFRAVDDLIDVHGIGPVTLERLRPWVYISTDDGSEGEDLPLDGMRGGRKGGETTKPQTKKEVNLKEPIDLNRATLADLQKLPGIGPKLSQRIVDERQKAGPFKSVDDLKRVSGFGPKTIDRLRPYVVVKRPESEVAAEER